MINIYTDEQLEELEAEERAITDEAIAAIILILSNLAKDLEYEVRKFYQKYGSDGVVTYAEARQWVGNNDHRKRLFVLFLVINEYITKATDEVKTIFNNVLKDVVNLESDFFEVDLDIDKILQQKWGYDESTWSDRLDDDFLTYEAKLDSELKSAMVRKYDVEDVVELIHDITEPFANRNERLVITESTAIGSFARKVIMKAKGAKKYRFYAREDERTCEHCGGLHGRVFPIAQFEVGVTASPIHPRCRCWEVPIID